MARLFTPQVDVAALREKMFWVTIIADFAKLGPEEDS
jgi:hypothetical protein